MKRILASRSRNRAARRLCVVPARPWLSRRRDWRGHRYDHYDRYDRNDRYDRHDGGWYGDGHGWRDGDDRGR